MEDELLCVGGCGNEISSWIFILTFEGRVAQENAMPPPQKKHKPLID